MRTRHYLALFAAIGVLFALLGCGGAVFAGNRSPEIKEMLANGRSVPASITDQQTDAIQVAPGSVVTFVCHAQDPDVDPLTYTWSGQNVTNPTSDPHNILTYTASTDEGSFPVTCTVTDDRGGVASRTAIVQVVKAGINHAPQATLAPATATVAPGGSLTFTATATDADTGDTLTYAFFAGKGKVKVNNDAPTQATYTAPAASGDDTVYCVVSDGKGGYTTAVSKVTVKP